MVSSLSYFLTRGWMLILAATLGFLLAPASGLAKTTASLGIVTTPGSSQYVCAVKFKELVEARSQGEFEVKLFHSGTLGSETDILQQIKMNSVQLGVITLGPFDTFVDAVKVVDFPFLFKDYEQADRVLDGPLGRTVLNSLEAAGFKGLAFSENGFRHLTNNLRPVLRVEDVTGLKIRVMESTQHKALWRVLGANPIPLPWPVYTELQQGVIDGQENPLSVIVVYNLNEVQKYLSLTAHVYSTHICVANLGWRQSLPAATQELLDTSMRDAAVYERQWNRQNDAAFLAELKKRGMIVDERPDVDSFRERAMRLVDTDAFKDPKTKALLLKFLDAVR